jgi:hypothetical protein
MEIISTINTKENCMIIFHLGTGDNFTMYALVMYYQKIYENVYIFCLYRNRFTVKQLYEKFDNIHVIILDPGYNVFRVPDEIISTYKNKINDCDLILTGISNPYWPPKNQPFWRAFYTDINIPYEIRYQYNDISRNNNHEIKLYNDVIGRYGSNYIFVHDHRSANYKHYDPRKNVEIDKNGELPIFHPNFNYYEDNINHKFYDLWDNKLLSDNLLDYCLLIENAKEIHITDSSFSCLCPYLNLDKIKIKCIYTNLDMVDYHKNFKNWILSN